MGLFSNSSPFDADVGKFVDISINHCFFNVITNNLIFVNRRGRDKVCRVNCQIFVILHVSQKRSHQNFIMNSGKLTLTKLIKAALLLDETR